MGLLLWLTKYKDPNNAYHPIGSDQPAPDGLDAAFEIVNANPAFTLEGLNKALDKAEQEPKTSRKP